MRILKISDVYFPRVNGLSTSIRTFAHELRQQGHEVTLICPAYPQTFDDEFEIIRIRSWYLFIDPEDRLMRRRPLRRLIDELRRQAIDKAAQWSAPATAAQMVALYRSRLLMTADAGEPIRESA